MPGHDDQPATRDALARHLDSLGVRGGTYHLYGAHINDAIVMDLRPEGWVVFYSERGGEEGLKVHEHEPEACADLLARVTQDEHSFFDLVAGPSPTVDADAAFDSWLRERGISREHLDRADWKFDDVPWVDGPYWRRYFVRITVARGLAAET